jgi:DNA-binding response OmpR family regulator
MQELSVPQSSRQTLLLVSKDPRLAPNLRSLAGQESLAIAQARELEETLRLARALRPVAILLDLDLPGQAAWEIADRLLAEDTCPPLILLSEQTDQFDVGTAIRAGSLVDKSAAPAGLLNTVAQVLAQSGSSQTERNSIQRVLIRWLRPCAWSVAVTPAHRFWGINE